MTWSAPMDLTIPTFVVLHTPVTCAPNALAICTAKVPTPPEAPMINTFCPGSTRPWSRRACRAVLAGNLTRNPELRFTNDGIPVCSFGIAVNRVRSRSEEVDFFDVSAWRELGQTIAQYKKKGDPILVEGRLQYRTWEAQDGSRRSKVDVVADNVQFLGRRGGAEEEDEVSLGGSA